MKQKNKLSHALREPIRDNRAERNLFARRILVALLLILALAGVLVTNLYHLQITNYEQYQTRSNSNRIKLLPIPPTRGIIYDRNGKVLAENLMFFGLYIVPKKTDNLAATFDKLRQVVDLSDEDIANFHKENQRSSPYVPILLKPNLTSEQMARFSVTQYDFQSLEVRAYFKRYYPYGAVMSHVLGYVGKINEKETDNLKTEGKLANYLGTQNIGKLGIERYYEEQLHGVTGFEEVEINNRGKVIRKLQERLPIAGKNIQLTIDLELQQYISNLIADYNGAVVVMDPKDNGILAMVSNPGYDNNLFVGGISNKNYQQLLNDPDRPLYNRVIQGVYPPASTIKPFISVAALQEGIITPNTVIYDPGYWILPNTKKRYNDWLRSGHGQVNLHKAIVESADTFFYQIAYRMGITRLSSWMNQFGFGMPTGLDIHEESSGIMPSREWKQKRYKKAWYQGDTIPVGIGQGYWIATPLQLAKATSILLNNGKINTPHLMQKVIDKNENFYQDPNLYPDISGIQQYWEMAKKGMHGVINDGNGTGRKAFVNTNYIAAGKSGTAQVFSLKEHEVYDAKTLSKKLHDHALFIAYAPYSNPEIVVSVILENAGGGSSNAAPIVRQVMDKYFQIQKKENLVIDTNQITKASE